MGMTGTRKKGKIPRREWTAIRERHAAGEALASIARDYDCTGPAIRYILSRTKGDHPAALPANDKPTVAVVISPGKDSVQVVRTGQDTEFGQRPQQPAVPTANGVARPDDSRCEGVGFGTQLRQRISSDIASFLVVFDCFLTDYSPDSVDVLMDATDRLMRTAARVRIELERVRSTEGVARAPAPHPGTRLSK